jgi:DNA invertase Pin-like site-specific DNA recombinase
VSCAVYARVSTLDQNPENQLAELRQYAGARGFGLQEYVGRNLKHLITLIDELQAVGVAFVSLGEGIDTGTPAGKLQLHILGALAKFERARIAERVRAGLARVKASGKRLGRPAAGIDPAALERTAHLSVRAAARELGVSSLVVHRARLSLKRTLAA